MEIKTKQNENAAKFDEITKKLNSKNQKGCAMIKQILCEVDGDECSRRRTLITSVRNIHNMLTEGFQLFTTKNDFERDISAIKAGYLELVVTGMPVSWIEYPVVEPLSDPFSESFVSKLNNDSQEK